jgi:UDP-N-acetylmuramate dehydrogenase
MAPVSPLQTGVSLRPFNTMGIDARARFLLPVQTLDDLHAVRADPALNSLPRLVLGGGSNLLFTGDFDGLVLRMRATGIAIVGETGDAVLVRAAAGESWHGLVAWTLAHGLGGMENLSLIPGSVGASPIQNIGAYGSELKDCFHQLSAFDFDTGALLHLDRAACEFGYRDSIFKHRLRDRAVITDVTFALPKRWLPNLRYAELAQEVTARGWSEPTAADISAAVIAIRQRKLPDPALLGNAGSFFKNPVVPAAQRDALLAQHRGLVSYTQGDGNFKLAAGWLIDQCGWKGRALGAAGVYEKQALVLVNRGGASGAEMVALAEAIQQDVEGRVGVRLEPEPVFV